MHYVTEYVKLVTEELPQTVRLVMPDIIRILVIMAARNVIKHVKHVMEELPQTVRLVSQDIIRIPIAVARYVINHV